MTDERKHTPLIRTIGSVIFVVFIYVVFFGVFVGGGLAWVLLLAR